MKVTKVTGYGVHPGWRKNLVFVKVETDAGITGWGEAYSQYDRDQPVLAQVSALGGYLIGRSVFDIKHFTQIAFDDYAARRGSLEFFCALSGIEQAMWDCVGKALKQPVYNLLGGRVRERTGAAVGHWLEAALADVHVDVAFLGTNGFSVSRGMTTPDQSEAMAKRAMAKAARRTVVVTDSTKAGLDHFHRFARPEDVALLITDTQLDDETAEQFDAAGTDVVRT